ncbi:gamma-glutamylcyclotransferase family protein [Clostridium tyrobutyricum]|uniref:gamma-glutamylcyclotransferase family protein n=1 Tax=Clostridium tyrobutyricum TaxID=1519 RepID=UPI00068B28C4|nr:gamma-glutamylcyclotransferase family protein [Clostridium tyrobutyricum]
MSEKAKLYGAYGSNMNLERMGNRCPKAKVVGVGVLENYKLNFRGRYKGVANIEPCKGRTLPIVLWEITEECERTLDLYEGFPDLYVKKQIKVTSGHKSKEPMFYVMADKYADVPAAPTEYYFGVIARGYSDNKIDLKTLEIAYSECLSELRGGSHG